MVFEHLVAENFRNIAFAAVDFHKGINVLCGENAAGKTNALEAIFLFAAGKSFRTSKEREFIRHGERAAKINIGYVRERATAGIPGAPEKTEHMMIRYVASGNSKAIKQMKFNGIDINRTSEFLGKFRAVLFTPDHLNLVKGAPEERRRFADIALYQIRPRYIYCLNEYAKILDQRNAFFKNPAARNGIYDSALLAVLNEQLAHAAAIVTKQRYGFCCRIAERAAEIYDRLTNETERLCIAYISSARCDYEDEETIRNKYLELYSGNVNAELKAGTTLYGPHRDDLHIFIGKNGSCEILPEPMPEKEGTADYPARTFGSQGQQRSAVLALKLAEGELFRALTGEYPLFLLDDLFSELDEKRKNYLLEVLCDKQVIITCCDETIFRGMEDKINLIHVKNGEFE